MTDKEKALEAWRNDNKYAPREVEHWFYFPTKENMDLFAVQAITQTVA